MSNIFNGIGLESFIEVLSMQNMLFKDLSLSTTFFGVAYCLCLTILESSWQPGSDDQMLPIYIDG